MKQPISKQGQINKDQDTRGQSSGRGNIHVAVLGHPGDSAHMFFLYMMLRERERERDHWDRWGHIPIPVGIYGWENTDARARH